MYGSAASICPDDPTRRSSTSVVPMPDVRLVLNDDVRTTSFSGNAFSVMNARGKFRSPCGQDLLVQNPRM